MDNFVADLRRALRLFRTNPSLVLVSVLSLGLGIGVNLAVFAALRAVFFHQATLADPDRAVAVLPGNSNQFSYLNYRDLRDSGIFETAIGFREVGLNLRTGGETVAVDGLAVTANFFDASRIAFERGRPFASGDAAAEREPRVAVLSYRSWQRRFNADAAIVGRALTINGEPVTVVGVLPARYRPVNAASDPEVYVPISGLVLPTVTDRRNGNALSVIGWLRAGMTRQQAQAAVTSLGRLLEQRYPVEDEEMGSPARIRSLAEREFGDSAARLVAPAILLTLFALVLVSACANVAGLLMTRSAYRQQEIAVRATLGASRGQLWRMLLAESYVLALAGAVSGGLLCAWLMRAIDVIVLPGAGVLTLSLEPDLPLIGYALLLVLATGLVCGLAPARSVTKANVLAGIQSGESHGATGRLRMRHAFVVVQVVVCTVLLVLSSLLLRTFFHVTSMDPGFDLDHGIVAAVSLDARRYASDGGLDFGQRAVERLEALPGVESAALANILALGTDASAATFAVEGRTSRGARTFLNGVSPRYFATLGIRIIRGRDFNAGDRQGSPLVAIVTDAFAHAYFPAEDALGKRVRQGDGQPYVEIVGIVGDHHYSSYGETPAPILYTAYAQRPQLSTQVRPVFVHVRTTTPPAAIIGDVRRAVAGIDPSNALDVRTLRDAAGSEPALRRIGGQLLASAGALALLLAAVGLYGMMAFVVASRGPEIGVRMALGATTNRILADVLGQGIKLVTLGSAIGAGLSLILSTMLASLLAGVSAADPIAYSATAAVLASVGLIACYVPARSAARLDPLVTLRRL